jgi:hypothetical protein
LKISDFTSNYRNLDYEEQIKIKVAEENVLRTIFKMVGF